MCVVNNTVLLKAKPKIYLIKARFLYVLKCTECHIATKLQELNQLNRIFILLF